LVPKLNIIYYLISGGNGLYWPSPIALVWCYDLQW
jgi:hypothetical protein